MAAAQPHLLDHSDDFDDEDSDDIRTVRTNATVPFSYSDSSCGGQSNDQYLLGDTGNSLFISSDRGGSRRGGANATVIDNTLDDETSSLDSSPTSVTDWYGYGQQRYSTTPSTGLTKQQQLPYHNHITTHKSSLSHAFASSSSLEKAPHTPRFSSSNHQPEQYARPLQQKQQQQPLFSPGVSAFEETHLPEEQGHHSPSATAAAAALRSALAKAIVARRLQEKNDVTYQNPSYYKSLKSLLGHGATTPTSTPVVNNNSNHREKHLEQRQPSSPSPPPPPAAAAAASGFWHTGIGSGGSRSGGDVQRSEGSVRNSSPTPTGHNHTVVGYSPPVTPPRSNTTNNTAFTTGTTPVLRSSSSRNVNSPHRTRPLTSLPTTSDKTKSPSRHGTSSGSSTSSDEFTRQHGGGGRASVLVTRRESSSPTYLYDEVVRRRRCQQNASAGTAATTATSPMNLSLNGQQRRVSGNEFTQSIALPSSTGRSMSPLYLPSGSSHSSHQRGLSSPIPSATILRSSSAPRPQMGRITPPPPLSTDRTSSGGFSSPTGFAAAAAAAPHTVQRATSPSVVSPRALAGNHRGSRTPSPTFWKAAQMSYDGTTASLLERHSTAATATAAWNSPVVTKAQQRPEPIVVHRLADNSNRSSNSSSPKTTLSMPVIAITPTAARVPSSTQPSSMMNVDGAKAFAPTEGANVVKNPPRLQDVSSSNNQKAPVRHQRMLPFTTPLDRQQQQQPRPDSPKVLAKIHSPPGLDDADDDWEAVENGTCRRQPSPVKFLNTSWESDDAASWKDFPGSLTFHAHVAGTNAVAAAGGGGTKNAALTSVSAGPTAPAPPPIQPIRPLAPEMAPIVTPVAVVMPKSPIPSVVRLDSPVLSDEESSFPTMSLPDETTTMGGGPSFDFSVSACLDDDVPVTVYSNIGQVLKPAGRSLSAKRTTPPLEQATAAVVRAAPKRTQAAGGDALGLAIVKESRAIFVLPDTNVTSASSFEGVDTSGIKIVALEEPSSSHGGGAGSTGGTLTKQQLQQRQRDMVVGVIVVIIVVVVVAVVGATVCLSGSCRVA